jgi:hypothetical protein
MKHFFKSIFYLTVLAGFLYSCDPTNEEEKSGEAKLVSFGFYAEDNKGILLEDYVVTDTTTTNWTVNLPAEVDKSALVARFVTSENDSVTVSGVGQVSGVTSNNFTVPVDYYVTDGKNNKRYTITVGKASSFVWTKITTFSADTVVGFIMKVNQKTGTPYILYKQDRINTADEKAAMVKLNGETWEFIGTSAGLSTGRIGSYMDFTFDTLGLPYVAYPDYVATVAQTASVRHFNGTEWVNVGNQGLTAGKVSYTALAFAPDKKLMLFNMLDAAAGGLQKREMDLSIFDGTAWATSNTITGRTSDQISYLPVAKLMNGALYVGIFNANTPSTFSIYKYQNSTWTVIADKVLETGATSSNLRDFDMDIDKEGNIYVAVADNASDPAVYKPRVKKYTAATQTWSNVGDVINLDLNTIRQFDLAVSPYGIPFLMYRNANQYPSVISLDSETQQWTAETVLENTAANDLQLDFAPNGQAFASFTNSFNVVNTFKFAAPAK